ncbi:unnamed protein product, partial [Allacma fusca]
MQHLKLKRGTLKANLTKLKTTVDGYTTDAIAQGNVEAHQRRLDSIRAELQSNHDGINAASADDAERNAHLFEFDEVDGKVTDLQASLNNGMISLLQPYTANQTTPPQTSEPIMHPVAVSLPKLSNPSFSGKVHEWLAFSDMFTTMVHNNPSLNDVN